MHERGDDGATGIDPLVRSFYSWTVTPGDQHTSVQVTLQSRCHHSYLQTTMTSPIIASACFAGDTFPKEKKPLRPTAVFVLGDLSGPRESTVLVMYRVGMLGGYMC
jgi:hypothetical protein